MSRVMRSMSHTESGLREEPLYKGTLRAGVWVLHATIYILSYTILSIQDLYLPNSIGSRPESLPERFAIDTT